MAHLETATISKRLLIQLGSATLKAMREHLSHYYPLIMEHDIAASPREAFLKVVDVEGMIAYAAWELPYEGLAPPRVGVPPLWGMNMGFVISLKRAETKMRDRVLKGRKAFGKC